MSKLRIFSKESAAHLEMETRLPLEIEQLLGDVGIVYRHLEIAQATGKLMASEELLDNLKQEIMASHPQQKFAFCSMASVSENFPNYERLRLRYLSEYYVEEDEGFLVIEGKCLLSFHTGRQVLQLLCEKGDFITIPAKLLRWMDMGSKASFTVIKCSEQAEAPVIFYTGSLIADQFSRLDV